jgi:hypothetical protein
MIATWAISQNWHPKFSKQNKTKLFKLHSFARIATSRSPSLFPEVIIDCHLGRSGRAAPPTQETRGSARTQPPYRFTARLPGTQSRKRSTLARALRNAPSPLALRRRHARTNRRQPPDPLLLHPARERERERGFWESSSGRQCRKLLQQRRWIRRSRSRTVYSLYTSA